MWVEAIFELGPKLAIKPYLYLVREGTGREKEGLVLKLNISSPCFPRDGECSGSCMSQGACQGDVLTDAVLV